MAYNLKDISIGKGPTLWAMPTLNVSSDSSGPSTTQHVSGAPVSLDVPPNTEDPSHPDMWVPPDTPSSDANGHTPGLHLRWDSKASAYTVIAVRGQSNAPYGSNDWVSLTSPAMYKAYNEPYLNTSDGYDPIPSTDLQHPEYEVPPEGNNALILRYDPSKGKDVIVGVRQGNKRIYFSKEATVDLVNVHRSEIFASEPKGNLPDPTYGLPPAYGSSDKHPSFSGKGDDGKKYSWVWNEDVGRYVATGTYDDNDNYRAFTLSEYHQFNGGDPHILAKRPTSVPAPLPEDESNDHLYKDKPIGTQGPIVIYVPSPSGSGLVPLTGQPIYRKDIYGHYTMVGIQVDAVDATTPANVVYFDENNYYYWNQSLHPQTTFVGQTVPYADPSSVPPSSSTTITINGTTYDTTKPIGRPTADYLMDKMRQKGYKCVAGVGAPASGHGNFVSFTKDGHTIKIYVDEPLTADNIADLKKAGIA
jgi:hypothetical protein